MVPALGEPSQVHLQETLTRGQGCVPELSGKSEGPLKMVTFYLVFCSLFLATDVRGTWPNAGRKNASQLTQQEDPGSQGWL